MRRDVNRVHVAGAAQIRLRPEIAHHRRSRSKAKLRPADRDIGRGVVAVEQGDRTCAAVRKRLRPDFDPAAISATGAHPKPGEREGILIHRDDFAVGEDVERSGGGLGEIVTDDER